MPILPPKPTTEGPRDRQVMAEVGQLTRALQTEGPQSSESLSGLVGANYWEPGRYERALTFAIGDGHVVRTADGRLAAT